MNQSQQLGRLRPLYIISLLISAAVIAGAFMIVFASQSEASDGSSKLNANNRCFRIVLAGESECNVYSLNNGRETNFFRVGREYNLNGRGASDSLEACEGTVYLWAYVHNSINTKYNHDDHDGPGIARNVKAKISPDNLAPDTFKNRHDLELTFSSDSASTITNSARIYCSKHDIALVMPQAGDLDITNHGLNPKATDRDYSFREHTYHKRHQQAVEVLGEFGFGEGDLFGLGKSLGYGGRHLPASRYYAAYIKIPVSIKKKPKIPEPCEPLPGQIRDPQTGECVCPDTHTLEGGECKKKPCEPLPGQIRDPQTGECVCPDTHTLEGGECKKKPCEPLPGQIRDPQTGECVCPDTHTLEGGECKKKPCEPLPGQIRDPQTGECVCPDTHTLEGGECKKKPCEPLPGQIRDPQTGECVCPEKTKANDKGDCVPIVVTGILNSSSMTPVILGIGSIALLAAFSRLAFVRSRLQIE